MALSSMTGFARREGTFDEIEWVLEARSVNGRTLDIKCRYPQGYEFIERHARDMGKVNFQRGQIALNVQIVSKSSKPNITINQSLINYYIEAGSELIKSGMIKPARLDGLLSLKGVIETSDEGVEFAQDELEKALILDINALFDDLKQSRLDEGRALILVLKAQLYAIDNSLFQAKSLSSQQTLIITQRYERRIKELMGSQKSTLDMTPDPDFEKRIIQEAAILGTKADVCEELDRLNAHLSAAHLLLDADLSQGRKLDFLAQEFMREANTLCSKSALTELTSIGLDLKSTIDQFREQCQNVE